MLNALLKVKQDLNIAKEENAIPALTQRKRPINKLKLLKLAKKLIPQLKRELKQNGEENIEALKLQLSDSSFNLDTTASN